MPETLVSPIEAELDSVAAQAALEESLPPADPQSIEAFEAAVATLLPEDTPAETTATLSSPEASRRLRGLRGLGRGALIRTGLEIAGVGVDAALLGAGNAGVVALQSAFAREAVATAPEIGVLNKLAPAHEHHKVPASKAKKVGEVVLGVVVAGVAQKFGVAVAEHADIAAGMSGFALPLAAKLGALSGVNATRRRFAARQAARRDLPATA